MTEWERTGPLSRGQGETCAGPNPALSAKLRKVLLEGWQLVLKTRGDRRSRSRGSTPPPSAIFWSRLRVSRELLDLAIPVQLGAPEPMRDRSIGRTPGSDPGNACSSQALATKSTAEDEFA